VKTTGKLRLWLAAVPMTLLGLILLVSGIGKAWAGTVAGQTEFFDVLLKSFWGPTLSWLIAWVLPWGEVALGVALILRIYPRLASALSLPLIAGFIANNSYAISQGMDKFPQCGYCFGIFEKFLGSPTPVQSLSIDIALFVFAMMVIFIFPIKFFSFAPWFKIKGGKKRGSDEKASS
jgi:uncharacterized membrane protein YphA (DoxX/SURF4 family)